MVELTEGTGLRGTRDLLDRVRSVGLGADVSLIRGVVVDRLCLHGVVIDRLCLHGIVVYRLCLHSIVVYGLGHGDGARGSILLDVGLGIVEVSDPILHEDLATKRDVSLLLLSGVVDKDGVGLRGFGVLSHLVYVSLASRGHLTVAPDRSMECFPELFPEFL